MSLPVTVELPLAAGAIYTVPRGMVMIMSTMHVSNGSGSARTFTMYVGFGPELEPISPIDQALAAKEIAISSDPIRLTYGCTIQAVASGSDVNCLITGKEISVGKDSKDAW